MHGFDPRALEVVMVKDPHNPGDIYGIPLDAAWEERKLISAVTTQDILSAPLNVDNPNRNTQVSRVSLIPWLRAQGYPSLADELDARPVTASTSNPSQIQQMAAPQCRTAATGSRLSTTKAAMISQHEHEWPTVAQDIKDAGRNGLAAAAKAGTREWYEVEAMAWARAKNRLQMPRSKELLTAASPMPTIDTLPSRHVKGC